MYSGHWRIMKTDFHFGMRWRAIAKNVTGRRRAHQHGATPPPDLPPRDVLDTAGDLLRALAAPVRIAIVLQLRESSRCVHELVDALGGAAAAGQPAPADPQGRRAWWPASGRGAKCSTAWSITTWPHIVVAAVTHAAEDGE